MKIITRDKMKIITRDKIKIIEYNDLEEIIPFTYKGLCIVRLLLKNKLCEKYYIKNNLFHRETGPAKIDFVNGKKYYYLNGKECTIIKKTKLFTILNYD